MLVTISRPLVMLLAGAVLLAVVSLPGRAQSLVEINAWAKRVQAMEAAGQLNEAVAEYTQMLASVEKNFGTDSDAASDVAHMLAIALVSVGKHAEAEPVFLRSLRIKERIYGANNLILTNRLNNLASTYKEMGRYGEAEPLHLRSLRIKESNLPADDLEIATTLNNLANLYKEQGRYSEAEPLYERTLNIWGTKLGVEHANVGTLLHNMGAFYVAQERYADAEPLYQRALAIREKNYGPNHPDVGQTLSNIAILDFQMGRYEEAQSLNLRNLKIQETRLGPDHPNVAQCLHNIAYSYHFNEHYAEAQANYERSLQILENKFGLAHPLVASVLMNLSSMKARQGKWLEAAEWADRSRRSTRMHIASVLPQLTEKQQRDFLATDKRRFHGALTMGLRAAEQPGIAELTAAWLLNGKGVGHAALVERALMTRDVKDSKLKPVVDELLSVRRRLADASMAVQSPEREPARKTLIQTLEKEEQNLMQRLSGSVPQGRAPAWIDFATVRQAIPKDGVLIDLARFEVFDFAAKREEKQPFQPARYAAWVTPPTGQGEPTVIDLGPADIIEAAVAKARQAIAKVGEANGIALQAGEAEAERQVRADLERVAELVWKPLAGKIGAAKQLIISPDGTLWLLPWSALPVGADKCLLEELPLHFVVSGGDLIHPAKTTLGTSKPAVFADPDFDLKPEQARQTIQSMFPNRRGDASEPLRGLATKSAIPAVSRLPNTALEAQAVGPSIASFTKVEPQTYLGSYSLESVVKAVQRPAMLLLSTHGFFLSDQEAKPGELPLASDTTRSAAVARDGKPLENPLLRCGLLFAGCNGKQSVSGDDGILTGMEIVGIDLRGTELVVLSACETGIGKVQNGEGVAGLRQAFQLAGAKSVVATLWQVPDRDSALIMSDFFANVAAGQSKAIALRNAQLKRIAARRDKYDAAHPFFWAAWTLTGE